MFKVRLKERLLLITWHWKKQLGTSFVTKILDTNPRNLPIGIRNPAKSPSFFALRSSRYTMPALSSDRHFPSIRLFSPSSFRFLDVSIPGQRQLSKRHQDTTFYSGPPFSVAAVLSFPLSCSLNPFPNTVRTLAFPKEARGAKMRPICEHYFPKECVTRSLWALENTPMPGDR